MHGHLNVKFLPCVFFISVKSNQKYLEPGVVLVTYTVFLRGLPHLLRIFATWEKENLHYLYSKVLLGLSKTVPQLSFNNSSLYWTKQTEVQFIRI